MLSMFSDIFSKKTQPEETELSVRSPDQISDLENLISSGPVTFVLVHADWCGPCQRYKPQWKELTDIPGRQTNVAMIHHDMVEKSNILKEAKIPGYPSVLKVFPNGHIETYHDEHKKATNGMPNIRDADNMKKELLSIPVLNKEMKKPKSMMNTLLGNNKNRPTILPVSQFTRRNISNMKGGSLYHALSAALQASGPTATLLFANEALRKNTAIPPKKNRGSTKRLTRKSKNNRLHKTK